jgi:hypothetical protein
MNSLILSLGPAHPNVLNLIRNHSDHAEELALKVTTKHVFSNFASL